MDPSPGQEQYRGLGRNAQNWTFTAGPDVAPPRSDSGRTTEFLLLGALVAFLLSTFAPWQRICMNFSSSFFKFDGCISANAWSATGHAFGITAGVCAILAAMALVLHLAGAVEGETADWLERVLVFAVVGAGGVKWLLVIDKAAAVGAWLGVLFLFAVAALGTVRARSSA
jgi:hypothetical protein